VLGRIFPGGNDNIFTTQKTSTPLFSQNFPLINFNPPTQGVNCPNGNNSPSINADTCTVPVTDILVDMVTGERLGFISVQGNGYVTGQGVLQGTCCNNTGSQFDGVFTGNLIIRQAGMITLNITSDGSFVLGVGNNAQSANNSGSNKLTVFEELPVLADFGNMTADGGAGHDIPIVFPTAGAYPFEINFTDHGGRTNLVMRDAVGVTGVRPVGAVMLNLVDPQNGLSQTLTATVRDSSNNLVSHQSVSLSVYGANQIENIVALTNDYGVATLHIQAQIRV